MKRLVILLAVLLWAAPVSAQQEVDASALHLGLSGSTSRATAGSGEPNGVVTGPVGSRYIDITTGLSWRKASGTGNTGWVATLSLAPCGSAGMFLRSTGSAWGCSTLVFPNAATANRIVYATSANTWGESENLTYDGTLVLVSTDADASRNLLRVRNTNAGTAARTALHIGNDFSLAAGAFQATSTGFTSSGMVLTNSFNVLSTVAGGMTIGAFGAGSVRIHALGSSTPSVTFGAALASDFGGTVTAPIVNATTGFRVNGAAPDGTFQRGDGTNYIASTLTLPNAITSGQIPYATGANTIGSGTGLTYTGSAFGVTGTGTFSDSVGIGVAPSGAGLLIRKATGSDFVAQVTNTSTANPYGLWVREPASAASGYQTFLVSDNAGTNEWLRVDSGTGATSVKGQLGHPSYASQTSNWRITAAGAGDFRYLFSDEMRVKLFSAEEQAVYRASLMVTPSYSEVSQAFTCPAASATSTLWVLDAATLADARVFSVNNWVVIRVFSRTDADSDGAHELVVGDCVGQVTNYTDGSGVNAGQQSWTFTRGSAGNDGSIAASTVIPVGNIVLDFGTSLNGAVELNAYDGAEGINAPYIQTKRWATSPVAANFSVTSRMGKLTGITGTANEFGFLGGTYAATDGQYIRASNEGVSLHGVDLRLWDGSTEVFTVRRNAGSPYLALGNPLPTAYATGAGVWMGKDGGVYKFRVGDPAGGRMAWDGSTLTAAGWTLSADRLTASNIELYSGTFNEARVVVGGGAANTAGINAIEVLTDIALWAGGLHANRASAPFRVTGAGALTASNATITGTINAASGTVVLDSTGATVTTHTSAYTDANAYRFSNDYASGRSGLFSYKPSAANRYLGMLNTTAGNQTTWNEIEATSRDVGAGIDYTARIQQYSNGVLAFSYSTIGATYVTICGSNSSCSYGTAYPITLQGNTGVTGTLTVTGNVRSNTLFNVNGTDGMTRVCNGTAGNLTFSGGILTNCTAADPLLVPVTQSDIDALWREIHELRAMVLALTGRQQR